MSSIARSLVAITTMLSAPCGGSAEYAPNFGLLPPLEKVSLNPLATLKAKQWPVLFSTIQSEMKDRWKLEIERSNAPPPKVTKNTFEVSFSNKTRPYIFVDIYVQCFDTPERAARELRENRFGGLRRLLSSYEQFHAIPRLGDEAYAYSKIESTIVGRSGNIAFEVGTSNQTLTRAITERIVMHVESATPTILDPDSSDDAKASDAARLIADYALTVEGGQPIHEPGLVQKTADDKWTVQYAKGHRQVTVHVLSSDDAEFKRLDSNTNGQIDDKDFSEEERKSLLHPLRKHNEKDQLEEAADLLKRIDKRIEVIQGKYAGLSRWKDPMETIERRALGKRYVEPDPKSSGKLLQLNSFDVKKRHRLVYHNRKDRCSLSIRVLAASTGHRLSVPPPHSPYSRAFLIAEVGPVQDEKLRKELLRIIQEELFREPGLSGIQQRAWLSAMALAHQSKLKTFPDLRWTRAHDKWFQFAMPAIVRGKTRLVFLCLPPNLRVGLNPSVPVLVEIARLAKEESTDKDGNAKRGRPSPSKEPR